MGRCSQKPEVPLLAREGERTGEDGETAIPAASFARNDARSRSRSRAAVLSRREGERFERSIGLQQDHLESGGGEADNEGRPRGEKDTRQTKPDEAGALGSHLFAKVEGTPRTGGRA